MSVLDRAVRIGDHVFLAEHAARRVVTVGAPREERFTYDTRESLVAARARLPEGAGVPRFVDVVAPGPNRSSIAFGLFDERLQRLLDDRARGAPPPAAFVYAAADGATLEEIAVRSELEGAALDPSTSLTIVARALRGAALPRTRDPMPPPSVAASEIRVSWDGAVIFLGHLEHPFHILVRPRGSPRLDQGTASWTAAARMLARFGRDIPEIDDVIASMNGAGAVTDAVLAVNTVPWLRVSARVDEALDRIGAVDDARLAGLVRALFPDHFRRATEIVEEIGLLSDDELAAVPLAPPG